MPVRESTKRVYKRMLTSSRAVMWVGFGGVLLLMIVIASSANRAVARIETGNVAIRRQFLERDHLLAHLRSDLYRSSLDVRDYLLNTDPNLAEAAPPGSAQDRNRNGRRDRQIPAGSAGGGNRGR